MHPPSTIKAQPVRQGPFLLQPSPHTLEGSEGGDATDIAYLTFGSDYEEDGEGETERLGIIMIAFQDGKIDICLDVEKVEARWETKQVRLFLFWLHLNLAIEHSWLLGPEPRLADACSLRDS